MAPLHAGAAWEIEADRKGRGDGYTSTPRSVRKRRSTFSFAHHLVLAVVVRRATAEMGFNRRGDGFGVDETPGRRVLPRPFSDGHPRVGAAHRHPGRQRGAETAALRHGGGPGRAGVGQGLCEEPTRNLFNKKRGIVVGWVFFLISLCAPHVRPMGRTCTESTEVEVTLHWGAIERCTARTGGLFGGPTTAVNTHASVEYLPTAVQQPVNGGQFDSVRVSPRTTHPSAIVTNTAGRAGGVRKIAAFIVNVTGNFAVHVHRAA